MPRVRNKYCDIIESITGETVPENPYDSLGYRFQVAQAIFFCEDKFNWDYLKIAKEIDVYPIVVWGILENWIRYDILDSNGMIALDPESFDDELAAHVEVTLICLCGAGKLERRTIEYPSFSMINYNPYRMREHVPLLTRKVEPQIRRELASEKPKKVEIKHKCPDCGRTFKEFPRFGACPSCNSPVGSMIVEKV